MWKEYEISFKPWVKIGTEPKLCQDMKIWWSLGKTKIDQLQQ